MHRDRNVCVGCRFRCGVDLVRLHQTPNTTISRMEGLREGNGAGVTAA